MHNVAAERHGTDNLVPLRSGHHVLTTEAQQRNLHACHNTHCAMKSICTAGISRSKFAQMYGSQVKVA